MSSDKESSPVIQELTDFVEFLRGLWAVLASISVLFPLSNSLFEVIPLKPWPDGGFAYFHAPVITTVTTITCLFMVLWLFGQRRRFRNERDLEVLPKRAGLSFIGGLVMMLFYLLGHFAISHDFYYGVLNWESSDLRRIFGDVILLIAYVGFFALLTRAFLLLGLREYIREQLEKVQQGE